PISRQTKSNLVSVNLNAAIEAVVVSFEETSLRGVIDIVRDYDPDLPALTVDEEKIRRLFTNLLINAQQAMEKGGEIRIKTKYDRDKNGVRVTITDTGDGIPEEIREKIFEPFFTTKQPGQGTGLGLAVSYGIVKEHGGEILAQNEAGGGASFILWFPLAGDKQ
ncbi:MAG: ATP-binding protein, partial [Desulfobacteraceae bacterium]|nr:ATP-binding protein [Desulfobacteraceae bacterium]